MNLHAIRITEGTDLKRAIIEFAQVQKLQAGVIVSAVGSLSKASLRMAGASPGHQDTREYEGVFEVVSLIGTIAKDGDVHLHMSISDKKGQVIGGHLKEGAIVHTTVELVVASEKQLRFTRKLDSATGFDELVVEGLPDD